MSPVNLFKYLLLGIKIKGKNNKIIAVKNGREYKISYSKQKIKINGNNNTLVINYDKMDKISRVFPKGLNLFIEGDGSTVEIEMPIKFSKSNINMRRGLNNFSIKSTKNKITNANITLCDKSTLIIGKDSEINDNFRVISKDNYKTPHKIIIGDRAYIARDVLIRNSDGQCFIDTKTGEALSEPQDIIIGDDVWVMSRCMIVKRAVIPNGCAVAPYSFVNKEFKDEFALLAGIPANIKKYNIKWVQQNYRQYMESQENN